MVRDFTFIDDISESVFRCCFKEDYSSRDFNLLDNNPSYLSAPHRIFNIGNNNTSYLSAPHRIFNIGNNNPIKLNYFVSLLEKYFDKKANINLKPMQLGDVKNTCADSSLLYEWIGFKPSITIEEGTNKFVKLVFKILW